MKLEGWQTRFWAVVEQYREQPFEWGVHDCALFAARCVDAQRGTDTTARVQATFNVRSAADYLRLVEERGGLEALVQATFGDVVRPMIPHGFCSTGDILLLEHEGRHILAVHEGHAAIAPGPQRLETVPLVIALGGWKI